ncbi:phosphopantetheine-binding protein, partial [Nitrosomonas sp. Nm166]|uniref:phosphopantetheine-binding protein n=1 Tax=Nitrosomonas sp. Nm166 TaxID=1881054 RepID=UPI0008DF7304
YMIPAAIVVLENLPLNANGKVDRKQLPEPEFVSVDEYEAPQGEVEEALAAIWREVLGMPRVGLHNNFFDLGGHSLLLIKVKQKMGEHLGVNIAIIDLFKYTTIASLAKFLSQGNSGQASLQNHRERAQRQRNTFIQRKRKIERAH